MANSSHPYEALTPDFVLDAIESTGRLSDARILTLNSYENRVFQVGIEESVPVIAKFYRPGRWTKEAIIEEHDFTQQLMDADISVVAPLRDEHQQSLFHYQGFDFAIYPRHGGHAPNLDDLDTLFNLGRSLGRIHAVGRNRSFVHRPTLNVQTFGEESVTFLLDNQFIPAHLEDSYRDLARQVLDMAQKRFDDTPFAPLRLHGDCHPGNILWRDDTAHFVDFDDARMGPSVQDFWMLLANERHEQASQLSELIAGYEEFAEFDRRELKLIEPLRSLRLLHYSAWLARRWEDPAFPHFFPWFNTEHYWQQQLLQLRDQVIAMDAEPIRLY
ncbi:MAG: serine/threonine protein kinase [Cellvibrio sp.]